MTISTLTRSSACLSPSVSSGANRPGWFLKLLALALFSSVLQAADKSGYAELVTLTPRDGAGLGTLSSYAGVTPVFEKTDANDTIRIPDYGVKEINLVWTFWQHKRPLADEWPFGKDARSVFTLQSPSDTTLRVRITVRADEWSPLAPSPEIQLQAGKPTRVELVLPEAAVTNPIDQLRVVFTSFEKIPELTITDWSIGKGSSAE